MRSLRTSIIGTLYLLNCVTGSRSLSGVRCTTCTGRLRRPSTSRLSPAGLVPAPVQGHLRIFAARPVAGQPGVLKAAELAVLESPDDLDLTVREG